MTGTNADMATGAPAFPDLVQRFEGLGRKDRMAVLEHMSSEDQVALREAIEAERVRVLEEQNRQRASDRQFVDYSPAIAGILEGAVKGEAAGLTKTAAATLVQEHRAALESHPQEQAGVWQRFVAFVERALAPPDGARP